MNKTVDTYTIKLKPFVELSIHELYAILELRCEVFVVEQDCPYQDLDQKDKEAHHLMLYAGDSLAAYLRILPKGISYDNYSSIGRVVNAKKYRNLGLGNKIMREGIEFCKKIYPNTSIKISAQCYLLKFYNKLGFKEIGDTYLEDNIPHIAMIYD